MAQGLRFTYAIGLTLAAVGLALIIDLVLIRRLAMRSRQRIATPQDVKILGAYSPVLTWIKGHTRLQPAWPKVPNLKALFPIQPVKSWKFTSVPNSRVRSLVLAGSEILLVIIWGLVITQPYMNMDPSAVPTGTEYGSAIQTLHLWTRFQQCGLCALWNGSTRGGSPAFVDTYGSMLHPLVAVFTLGWGVPNGAKLLLSLSFILAGLAQLWLGYILKLHWPARLWAALMSVVSGHLAAAMELGVFGIVFSSVACAFVFPALLWLFRNPTRRAAMLLAITLGSAALAGQGYMQIGLMTTFPAALLLLEWKDRQKTNRILYCLSLAALVAFLLAAPFLIPFLHFSPLFAKDIDPEFRNAQPFEYVPLNLVIRDIKFEYNDALQKVPSPALNVNYIGWTAVLLALFALRKSRGPEERKSLNFLATSVVIILWLGSGQPLKWVVNNSPTPYLVEMAAGVRHPGLISGLAIAPLLGLAGIGLDQFLTQPWPRLGLIPAGDAAGNFQLKLDLRWLVIIPLVLAINNAYLFGKTWIATRLRPDIVDHIISALKTPSLEWVNPPFGEHPYIESAVAAGLKIYGVQTWNWRDRQPPQILLSAEPNGVPPGSTLYQEVDGIRIYRFNDPSREYALLTSPGIGTPKVCSAHGLGGDIDVECNSNQGGTLDIKENAWSGWNVSIDGHPAILKSGANLAVDLPAGQHKISFRYRPWDVPLGLLVGLAGIALCIILWSRDEHQAVQQV